MKTIAISTKLLGFDNKTPLTDVTKEGSDKDLTVKDILINRVGRFFPAENKERAILAFKVAQKIYDCKTKTLDLEDAEFKMVKDAMEKPTMSPIVEARVHEVLDAAEISSKKKPSKK